MLKNTPLAGLEQSILQCTVRISPTNGEKFERFAIDKGLSVEFTDKKQFDICVDITSHTIRLPVVSLYYLWSSAYLMGALRMAADSAAAQGKAWLDTGADPKTSTAIELFVWAGKNLCEGSAVWPDHLPRPSQGYEYADVTHLATELFLAGLAWILHHECAHVALEHQVSDYGVGYIQEEKDADRRASEWVMEGCASEAERRKRAYGIASGALSVAMLESPLLPAPTSSTHPPQMNRLIDNLAVAGLDPDDSVYQFTLTILQFCVGQYDLSGAAPEEGLAADGSSPSFADMCEELACRYHVRHRS